MTGPGIAPPSTFCSISSYMDYQIRSARQFGDVVICPLASCSGGLRQFLDRREQRIVVLLGDFGSGKTTTLQRLMYDLAREKLATATPTARVPLLVSLRDFSKTVDFDSLWVNFLNNEVGLDRVNLPLFRRLNEAGHFVFLLDGFDEMARLVTAADRRLTLRAVMEQSEGRCKLILSGRPGYFPDNAEMLRIFESSGLGSHLGDRRRTGPRPDGSLSIRCVQLMDRNQIDQYIARNSAPSSADQRNWMEPMKHGGLRDLARRPVLTNMIIESLPELVELPVSRLNLGTLYETYTGRWIMREEGKTRFRLLIDPGRKRDFLSLLALQMHFTEELVVQYRHLDAAFASTLVSRQATMSITSATTSGPAPF